MKEVDTYIIRRSGAGWAVCLNDKTLGVFETRPDAVQAAVIVAEASGRAGRGSAVLTEQENGALFPFWEYGRDVYSPPT